MEVKRVRLENISVFFSITTRGVNMKLVIVENDYINYLKQFSKDVKENKNASRPYVGIREFER